jgi:hypothetical protein
MLLAACGILVAICCGAGAFMTAPRTTAPHPVAAITDPVTLQPAAVPSVSKQSSVPPASSLAPATPSPKPKKVVPKVISFVGTPTRVIIPYIGVNEAVQTLGISYDPRVCGKYAGVGCIVPHGDELSWYDQSAMPGQPGVSLIIGHDEDNGPATFWKLDTLPNGKTYTETVVQGNRVATLTYQVVSSKSELKTSVQHDASVHDAQFVSFPEQVLVTCNPTSPYYHDNPGYHHIANWIVYSRLISVTAQ